MSRKSDEAKRPSTPTSRKVTIAYLREHGGIAVQMVGEVLNTELPPGVRKDDLDWLEEELLVEPIKTGDYDLTYILTKTGEKLAGTTADDGSKPATDRAA